MVDVESSLILTPTHFRQMYLLIRMLKLSLGVCWFRRCLTVRNSNQLRLELALMTDFYGRDIELQKIDCGLSLFTGPDMVLTGELYGYSTLDPWELQALLSNDLDLACSNVVAASISAYEHFHL